MKPKAVSGIMLTLLLAGMLTLAFNIQQVKAEPVVIVISGTQTWNGDFVVNDDDTVIIENCNFTVEDGDIWVYGSLIVENSSITIHRDILFKEIWVVGGSLTLSKSTLVGRISIDLYSGSIAEVKNSTIRWIFWDESDVLILNSTFRQAQGWHGNGSIVNSEGMWVGVSLQPFNHFSMINSSVTEYSYINIQSALPDSLNVLQIPSMYVDTWSLLDVETYLNVTVSNSFVHKWWLDVCNTNPSELVDFALVNSTLECMGIAVFNPPTESYNFTFQTGTVQNQNIYVDNNFNITMRNSTIDNWGFNVFYGTFQFGNSNFSSGIYYNSSVTIFNSTMGYLATSHFQGKLDVSNVTANTFCLGIECGSMDLVLAEGYQDFINFYSEEQDFNITIVESKVNHWGIQTTANATVNIYNSTITGLHPEPSFSGLNILRHSSITIYNSHVEAATCHDYAFLTLVNSTMDTIYAWDCSNITAINSTIGTIISDPITVTLINSFVLSEIHLPVEVPPEYLSISIPDESPVPLPSEIKRFSKFLHIVTTYEDTFSVQVRIHYDENEVKASEFRERDLKIYYLEEGGSVWSNCSIQGVNTLENYVWANVTHFSYFVVGASTSTPPSTPQEALNDLVNDVETMNLQQGMENSLDAKLANALASLEALNAKQRNDAINKLHAFINEVEAQRENKITNEQANYLVSEAQEIIDLING